MRKPMKKGAKICLGILLIVALLGACFSSVAIYAKREMNKPKFTVPEQPMLFASSIPVYSAEAASYAAWLYAAAQSADNAQVTLRTDVSFDGDWQTPFSEADTQTLRFLAEKAAPAIAALYPAADGTIAAQTDLPQPNMSENDVLDFSAETGQTADGKEDESRLILDLVMDPDGVDTAAMTGGGVYAQIAETLADACEVEQIEIVPVSSSIRMEIDRTYDRPLTAEITNAYRVTASLRLAGDYRALSAQETVTVELPYETTQNIGFSYFGARFTERAIAVNPSDQKALPAEVSVRSDAEKDDYTLSFTSSVPDALSFDSDGVMTVEKLTDEPVTVTMTLEYDGYAYTDTLTVYVTQWEVTADD